MTLRSNAHRDHQDLGLLKVVKVAREKGKVGDRCRFNMYSKYYRSPSFLLAIILEIKKRNGTRAK